MAKKRKKYVLIGFGLFVVAIAALFYLALREDPRYVEAAKGLEQARTDAKDTFGALTWEEYREENGTVLRDDREAWRLLKESTPARVEANFLLDTPPSEARAVTFKSEEAWFDALQDQIEPLTLQPIYEPSWHDFSFESLIYTKELTKSLTVAVTGAADLGDTEAMSRHGQTVLAIIDKLGDEPALMPVLVGIANRAILLRAIGNAAIKNRSDIEVANSAKQLLEDIPDLPRPIDVLGAECRCASGYISQLQKLSPGEIPAWLNDIYGMSENSGSGPSVSEQLREIWDNVIGRESTEIRRTGRHTADGLEARYWETALEMAELVEDSTSLNFKTSEAINQLIDQFRSEDWMMNDPSYELADMLLFAFFDSFMRMQFSLDAYKASLEITQRYPVYTDLPNAMPDDLRFKNEYGRGTEAIYRKTSTGFIIYSVAIDGVDDGFVCTAGYGNAHYISFFSSDNGLDWGTVVNYAPSDPAY